MGPRSKTAIKVAFAPGPARRSPLRHAQPRRARVRAPRRRSRNPPDPRAAVGDHGTGTPHRAERGCTLRDGDQVTSGHPRDPRSPLRHAPPRQPRRTAPRQRSRWLSPPGPPEDHHSGTPSRAGRGSALQDGDQGIRTAADRGDHRTGTPHRARMRLHAPRPRRTQLRTPRQRTRGSDEPPDPKITLRHAPQPQPRRTARNSNLSGTPPPRLPEDHHSGTPNRAGRGSALQAGDQGNPDSPPTAEITAPVHLTLQDAAPRSETVIRCLSVTRAAQDHHSGTPNRTRRGSVLRDGDQGNPNGPRPERSPPQTLHRDNCGAPLQHRDQDGAPPKMSAPPPRPPEDHHSGTPSRADHGSALRNGDQPASDHPRDPRSPLRHAQPRTTRVRAQKQ